MSGLPPHVRGVLRQYAHTSETCYMQSVDRDIVPVLEKDGYLEWKGSSWGCNFYMITARGRRAYEMPDQAFPKQTYPYLDRHRESDDEEATDPETGRFFGEQRDVGSGVVHDELLGRHEGVRPASTGDKVRD